MNAVTFIKVALKDYKVGAFTISSRFAVSHILQELGKSASFLIEYGAGDGVITRDLVSRIPLYGKVVAVELNEHFLPDLRKIDDERLIVLQEDVAKLSHRLLELGLPRIDAVISGIPFSFFNPKTRERIVRDTAKALAPGGRFIIYQYSPLLFPILKKYFSHVKMRLEPRNLPPYFIMTAYKK